MSKEDLSINLRRSADGIRQIFSSRSLEDLADADQIEDKVKDFAAKSIEKLVTDIYRLAELTESPVYIGMLGRYSHGKSALVNALFDLTDENKLPEGDGIVTSKVTSVSFDLSKNTIEASEVTNDGEVRRIEYSALQNEVKSSSSSVGISYYQPEFGIFFNHSRYRLKGAQLPFPDIQCLVSVFFGLVSE